MSDWISVSERLPENSHLVVVMYVDHIGEPGVEIAYHRDTSIAPWSRQNGGRCDGVTHWMPIPEPPK